MLALLTLLNITLIGIRDEEDLTMRTIRLAMRDWAWLTPLALGEVDTTPVTRLGAELELERVQTLPGAAADGRFELAEASLSRFVLDTAAGQATRYAVPFFAMQAFRSRCVLVRQDSTARSAGDLVEGRVGLTGWHDSGNIWTRDALRHDGLDTDGVQWRVGPLTGGAKPYDRLGPGPDRADVAEIDEAATLVDLLLAGELEAVLTPFMPPQAYGPDAPIRPLYADSTEPELAYYADRGYVPGIHILTGAPDLPVDLARAVVDVLVSSRAEWTHRRSRMLDEPALGADTAYQQQRRHLRPGWDATSLQAHRAMIQDFLELQVQDGITSGAPSVETLFTSTQHWK